MTQKTQICILRTPGPEFRVSEVLKETIPRLTSSSPKIVFNIFGECRVFCTLTGARLKAQEIAGNAYRDHAADPIIIELSQFPLLPSNKDDILSLVKE